MNKFTTPGPSLEGFMSYIFLQPHGIVVGFTLLLLVTALWAEWARENL